MIMINSGEIVETDQKKAKRPAKHQEKSGGSLPSGWTIADNKPRVASATLSTVISKARQGVPRQKITEVQNLGLLSAQEMAGALHVSVRSLYPVSTKVDSHKEHLDTNTSERLLLLEQLLLHGLSVFDGDAKGLSFWLHSPLPELALTAETVDESTPLPIQEMGQLDEPYFMAGVLPEWDREQVSNQSAPQTPLDMLDTVSGYSLVDAVLSRIEWGIYS